MKESKERTAAPQMLLVKNIWGAEGTSRKSGTTWTMTQTRQRDGKRGSNESHINDKKVWNMVVFTLERLSNQGPCQMGY